MILKLILKIINYFYDRYSKIRINMLLSRGLNLGKNVFIGKNVTIDPSHCWLISIEDNCTLARGVTILAHDASTKIHTNYTKIGSVSIGRSSFIGANTIIIPGVKIGKNSIIGAGSVVTKSIPDNSVAVGNPARVICSTMEYVAKHKDKMKSGKVYGQGFTLSTGINTEKKEVMKKETQDENGYVI